MLIFFHKMMGSLRRALTQSPRQTLNNEKGQVALILILLAAFALILYAVILNLGQVTETKTTTTIAANSGASLLASQMASYGQNLFQTTLGGKVKICKGGFFSFFLRLLIALVVAVFAPPGLPAILATISVILSAISIVLQLVYIQPKISDMWNKIQERTLTQEGQFLEQGIRAALSQAVTDQEKVPDMYDFDTDAFFGLDGNGRVRDSISRFSVFYDTRIRDTDFEVPDLSKIRAFVEAAQEFLYDNPFGKDDSERDFFALTDPAAKYDICQYDMVDNPNIPSQCNVSCQPPNVPDPATGEPVSLVPACSDCYPEGGVCPEGDPDCCPHVEDQCGTVATCQSPTVSPYVNSDGTPPQYAYVYDPILQRGQLPDDTGDITSYLETLGTDDENPHYYKDHETSPLPINQLQLGTAEDFLVDDATGIFPFFYMLDWGIDLAGVDRSFDDHPEYCYWFDSNFEPLCPWAVIEPLLLHDHPLDLPVDPTKLIYNTTYFVDGENLVSGDPPLVIDRITGPENIVAPDDVCANTDMSRGFFKEGADRYCSSGDIGFSQSDWPYDSNCAKNLTPTGEACETTDGDGNVTTIPCRCEQADPTLWHDDALDEVVYGLRDFIRVTQDVLERGDLRHLGNTFQDWYDNLLAPYLEQENNKYICDDENEEFKDLCVPEENRFILEQGVARLDEMASRLKTWRDQNFAGSNCADAWCVPPESAGDCGGKVPPEELATFNADPVLPQGDMNDILACLNYNVEGYDFTADQVNGEGIRQGNDYRYQKCGETCSLEYCYKLPRSLLPDYDREGFDVSSYADPDQTFADLSVLRRCLDHCGSQNCNPVDLPGGGYPAASFDPFACQTWGPGNEWYDAVKANLDTIVPATDQDTGKLLTCLDQCSTVNCVPGSTLPLPTGAEVLPDGAHILSDRTVVCGDGVEIAPDGTVTPSGSTPCIAPEAMDSYIYPHDALTADQCLSGSWGPGNEWYDSIVHNVKAANASCSLLNDQETTCNPWVVQADGSVDVNASCDLSQSASTNTGWLFQTRHSALEAENQIAKMRQRRDFLAQIVSGLNGAISAFEEGRDRLQSFITNAVNPLIEVRRNLSSAPVSTKTTLSQTIIYGWQSEPTPARNNLSSDNPLKGQGYWHIVRVQGGVPLNCPGSCGATRWPYVRTYTKGFLGTTRCYELMARQGDVKMRVTRWDEDLDTNALRFPNGTPIWKFRGGRIDRGSVTAAGLSAHCRQPPEIENLILTYNNPEMQKLRGAFILEPPPDDYDPLNNPKHARYNMTCWNHATALLASGVMSETCAHYYYHEGRKKGFSFEFFKCKDRYDDW